MPNHIHGVIVITGTIGADGSKVGAALVAARSGTCSQTTAQRRGTPCGCPIHDRGANHRGNRRGGPCGRPIHDARYCRGAPCGRPIHRGNRGNRRNHKGCPYVGQNRRGISNQLQPLPIRAGSRRRDGRRFADDCGSVIISNTSFATRIPCTASGNTSRTTRPTGRTTQKTRSEL